MSTGRIQVFVHNERLFESFRSGYIRYHQVRKIKIMKIIAFVLYSFIFAGTSYPGARFTLSEKFSLKSPSAFRQYFY